MSLLNLCLNIIHKLYTTFQIYMIFPALSRLRRRIDVRGNDETLNFIIKNQCSISRYGDGEFDMILEYLSGTNSKHVSGFQDYNPELAKRLYEIVSEHQTNFNHIVCIPLWFHRNLDVYKQSVQNYCKEYLCRYLKRLFKVLNHKRVYYNANISRFYLSYVDKSHCKKHVEKLKQIWDNRNLCIVEGEKSRLGVGNDLFSNSQNIKRILCPSVNAFDKYDEILSSIINNIDKGTLIIIALGHTATVLAYDLARMGYQALDLGHIDIEYEWMKLGATEKVAVKNKYVNEVTGGNEVLDCKDDLYLKQIILHVE